MIFNYLKIAIRSLKKNKAFSAINIFGLAIGLACCMLIMAYIAEETSYDRQAPDSGQIYRLGIHLVQNGGTAEYPDVDGAVGPGIRSIYPEVLDVTRIFPANPVYVKVDDRIFKESRIALCDSNFLRFFSIPLAEGDPKIALSGPGIVVTRAFAKKYFGDSPALGKALPIFGQVKITGIINQLPDNTHFHFDAFIFGNFRSTTWSNIGFYTYLKLAKNANPAGLEAKFPDLVMKYIVPESVHDMGITEAEARKSAKDWHFYLMPVTDIHLRSHSKYELEPNGDIQYVYIFGALALFILLLACLNFANLATVSSAQRAREVGIRKVLGSLRSQLIGQFLAESVVLTLLSMVVALVFVSLLLPLFNELSGKHFDFSQFLRSGNLAMAFLLALMVGFLSGLYPAFFLSAYRTIAVLKGGIGGSGGKRTPLRKGLVVFQFIISTFFIISTVFVYQQIRFMQNKKLGYDPSQVLMIEDTYALQTDQLAFRQSLLQDSRVINATISRDAPVDHAGSDVDGSEFYAKGSGQQVNGGEIHIFIFHVDYDYLSTLGMHIAAGRYFSRNFSTDDSSSAVVINEAAVRELGFGSDDAALNKVIVRSGQKEYRVIGVVNDFNYASAKQKIAPLMMLLGQNSGGIMVKVRTTDIPGFIESTKQKWAAYNLQNPFSWYFLDDRFAALYTGERKTGELFTFLTVIAVLIASMGLVGLVAFTTQQRTKEIGVRKVLGASVRQVLILLSREFLWLVTVAFLISVPLTWWAMHAWLNNFAYRISMAWWVFLLAGAAAIIIALVAISANTIKAALSNPVKSLRSE
jgi:putative ABC transport system permease protein